MCVLVRIVDWETGVRVPLVISAPWLSQSAGLRSASIVELVDIMPTTIDLAGLQPPEGETLDGTSLGELLRKPLAPTKSWDKVALSQYPRCPASKDGETWTTNTSLMWINNWCEFTDRVDIPWMGFSMRTSEYRALISPSSRCHMTIAHLPFHCNVCLHADILSAPLRRLYGVGKVGRGVATRRLGCARR